jgi:hypothetical protein
VPFTVTIPDKEQDGALPDQLKAEWPGILAWALHGCLEWQRIGLAEPADVTEATRAYQAEMNTLGQFVAECCWVKPDNPSLRHSEAHQDPCHRLHSCPSDHNAYVCGDKGRCNQCPDNEYCQARQPRVTPSVNPDSVG